MEGYKTIVALMNKSLSDVFADLVEILSRNCEFQILVVGLHTYEWIIKSDTSWKRQSNNQL